MLNDGIIVRPLFHISVQADSLHRLSYIGQQQLAYAPNGNITQMPGVGSMAYGNTAKPYQVTALSPTGGAVPIREQQVSYTSFQRPNSITENEVTASFVYDTEGNRVKMNIAKGSTPLLTRYYLDNCYEIDAQQNVERLYLAGDAYSAPAVYVKENGSGKIYYICRDYLGSITHIANADGTLKQELSYDAWGRLRDSNTQVVYEPGKEPELFLGRGYTGHEHLSQFGLINMNARLYDAALGRFLSPDPYVQMPDFTQNFNRYSYGFNNPLLYVDENGQFFFSALIPGIGVLIDAACWGAVIGAAGYTTSVAFSDGGFKNWSWNNFGKAVGMGVISGVITSGIGSALGAVGSNGFWYEAARAYVHGFANGAISQLSGGDFMQGFATGGLSSLVGSTFMMYGGVYLTIKNHIRH